MSLHHPAQNHLLAALPAAELERLRSALEVVPMPSGRVVHDERLPQRHVYFPTGSIIAMLYGTSAGEWGRVAIVGREGCVGIASFIGGEGVAGDAIVQSSGYAYRLPVPALHAEFRRGGRLRELAQGFTRVLIEQMTQTAVCRRHHALGQQICAWLLLSADRLPRPRLAVGFGAMLRILGASQERVLHEFAVLQARGLVRFERGAIELLDRAGLEAEACACYGAVVRAYGRLWECAGAPPASRRADPSPIVVLAEAS